VESQILIVGDFNTSCSPIDRTLQLKINSEILKTGSVMNQMNLKDNYMTFHQYSNEYTFFSALHGTSPKLTIHLIRKQAFTDPHGVKLDFNNRNRKSTNHGN
jgi:exonuclease III